MGLYLRLKSNLTIRVRLECGSAELPWSFAQSNWMNMVDEAEGSSILRHRALDATLNV